MRPLPPVPDHREPLSQMCLPAMPYLIRPRVQSLLQHPNMSSRHMLLMSPMVVRRWTVLGIRNAKFLNNKGVMTRMVTVERQVLKGSLHTFPVEHDLFTRHRLEWMVMSIGSYSKKMVLKFYASYLVTLGVLWTSVRTPPNTAHSQMFEFEALGWTFLLLPSVAKGSPHSRVRLHVGVGQEWTISLEQRSERVHQEVDCTTTLH